MINSKDLNKKSIEALAMVGALDCLENRDYILANIETILSSIQELNVSRNSAQNCLFGAEVLSKVTIKLERKPQSNKKQHLAWEKQFLGLYVSDHPANDFKDSFEISRVSLVKLTKEMADQNIMIGGVIVSFTKILLKTGKNMAFVTIEDGKPSIECLIFPKLLEEIKEIFFEEGKVVTLTGKISAKDGDLKFLADSVKEITNDEILEAKRLMATKNRYSSSNEKNENLEKESVKPNIAPSFSNSENNNFKTDFSQNKEVKSLTIKLPEIATKKILEDLKHIFEECQKGTLTSVTSSWPES